MYVFSSVVYRTDLCISSYFVLILLYVQVLSANSTSENSSIQGKQFKSTDQPSSGVDSQIPKCQKKCCFSDEWLLYSSSDNKLECRELPLNIKNISLKSSWFRTFSKFGVLIKSYCLRSDQTEVWTKSNARYYRYYSENETVFNSETKRYYYVACSDYINLHEHYSDPKNYENNENFKKLESEISQFFLCNIPEEDLEEKIKNFLDSYGMGVSNFFLAVTFYLYISTPKLRRKVHDKCFLCQLATLIIAFSFTIWRQQLGKEDEPSTFCAFIAFMNQYWCLSAFSWFTVLSTDLWRVIAARKSQHSDARKMTIYCLCAWGFPLVMSFATFCATQLDDESYFKVDFHQAYCWFQKNFESPFLLKQPEFTFFYSYISLTLLINVCLFIHISVKIITNDYCWKKGEDSRKHEANKNRFRVYLKLFLVMGLTWLLEIISYFDDRNKYAWLWLVLDLQGNLLQGFLIFVVSVCNTRVKALLKERFFSSQEVKSSSVSSRNANSEGSKKSLSTKVSSTYLFKTDDGPTSNVSV